ncbi:uncharacterized protein LOC126999780 isoform X7 [Eriocheir sinensis]|uniref:uncharacterized protein LOC126999780 isoform X7 n=1 Tax=Eriocheir sinensis TaxID=95602 RepID=UPI0021C924F1|nr:uncharacterized protein LOC126999780 isoform X7 [Eriocheir sinensis]XP_050718646.1 uncharacterized protein LOC126999780 isoform X7 [Eriocheir sinensis]XP_050718647.1 uncharacterized protein LOC126999780 isoform X7 [Eriocheir sinensis]XP_050718648.1 uncharacterized protein LOC126999780 isoform X7 [Eriocheir sinensis]
MKVTGWTTMMTVVLMALVLVLGPGVEAGSNTQGDQGTVHYQVFNGLPAIRPSAGAVRRCSRPPCRRPPITQWFFG